LFGGGSGVVLGQYFVDEGEVNYVAAAESNGANSLNVRQGIYNFFVANGEWWTVNRAFLDSSIFRGQQFYLSSAPMGSGGFLMEMEYLQGLGINPYSLPWAWIH